jgi:GrpB-like predicted nucleotidyltransferase (UPF0157 family)
MADQEIEVADYDAGWPELFAEQRPEVEKRLGPWLCGPVEHIGSTSVPGLRSKPIIDMLAPVGSLADAQAAVPVLGQAGWLYWPDDPCRHYRLWFLRQPAGSHASPAGRRGRPSAGGRAAGVPGRAAGRRRASRRVRPAEGTARRGAPC